MFRLLYRLLAVLMAFCVITSSVLAQKVKETMSVHDLKTGMKGYGKTVVSGRKIENFDIEILGVLQNNKINESLLINGRSILVKVSGEAIKQAGGIASGMSGSPVYVDNKLIGGLSSGWLLTDHTVGLVTPIEEMLEIWTYPDVAFAPSVKKEEKTNNIWKLNTPVKLGCNFIDTIYEIDNGSPVPNNLKNNETVFAKVAGDIYINGLEGRAAENFKSKIKGKNVIISKNTDLNFADSYETDNLNEAAAAFEPGSALAIQLARGDISMATLGTMTHRSGHRILALAHPFLKKGSVSFLMTGAYIHHSFASVQMPFKIGAPTEMLGIITQDREKGISGNIGRLPEMVPISIDVYDKDLQTNRSINYQIVKDVSVFNYVLESTLIQAIEGATDRVGAGTAHMSIALDCASKSGQTHSFRRENIFYSKNDIVQSLVTEVLSLMEMVTDSEFEEAMPTRLILKIEIEKKRKTLQIEKVEVKNSSISGGGMLEVELVLKPFREKKIIRRVKLPIPQDIGKENLVLTVCGLNTKLDEVDSMGNVASDARENKTLKDLKSVEETPTGFESVIRSWVNSPRNSDILFQLAVEGDETKKIKLNGKDFEIQPTNLVVSGRIDTTLTLSEE